VARPLLLNSSASLGGQKRNKSGGPTNVLEQVSVAGGSKKETNLVALPLLSTGSASLGGGENMTSHAASRPLQTQSRGATTVFDRVSDADLFKHNPGKGPLCLTGSESGGQTIVFDWVSVAAELSKHNPGGRPLCLTGSATQTSSNTIQERDRCV
jgi:hypothetical protein